MLGKSSLRDLPEFQKIENVSKWYFCGVADTFLSLTFYSGGTIEIVIIIKCITETGYFQSIIKCHIRSLNKLILSDEEYVPSKRLSCTEPVLLKSASDMFRFHLSPSLTANLVYFVLCTVNHIHVL